MKSIENICCKEKPALTFPRLMRGKQSGAIYLVNKVRSGYSFVVVKGEGLWINQKYNIGEGYTAYEYLNVEDYDGTITLSND